MHGHRAFPARRDRALNLSLYSTPININPEDPALPISHPTYYATYLAKLLGAYSTLGMAEDTWALNEHAIDNDAFLKQAYLTCGEREAMFFSALDRTRRGVVACVFDTTDRVQHMFFAQKDKGGEHSRVIEDLYMRADTLVGKDLPAYVDEETVLFVISAIMASPASNAAWTSTPGCCRMAISLSNPARRAKANHLRKHRLVAHTRAYTFGLGEGIYLNLRQGREAKGIVEPGAAASALKRELAAKLSGLRDEERDRVAIRQAWPSESLYTGPYLDAAPDLILGFADGYRASWDAAVGKVGTRPSSPTI